MLAARGASSIARIAAAVSSPTMKETRRFGMQPLAMLAAA
jgi:hypothetical protein